jgi:SOS response regulatory protein OraA/RecX
MRHKHRKPQRRHGVKHDESPPTSGGGAGIGPNMAEGSVITSLTPVRGRSGTIAVRLGRVRVATVPASEVAALGLRAGMAWTESLAERCRAAQERLETFTAAARILARHPRSAADLASRLRRRGCSASAINHAVALLSERNLLNDARLARALISAEMERRAVGRARLAAHLARAGIPRAVAEPALREALAGDDPTARALEAARRRMARSARVRPGTRDTDPDGVLRRLAGYLARLGFDAGTALKAARTAMTPSHPTRAPDDGPVHTDDEPHAPEPLD